MSDVVDLVSNALRRKLLDQGARSLTDVEWHLLRVSHFLNAIEDSMLDRLLADTPQAELLALAVGLEAIEAADAARRIRAAARDLAEANTRRAAAEYAEVVAALTRSLGEQMRFMRAGIEQQLLAYAFRQRELEPGDVVAI
jgi:hypothetical protein